MGSIPFSPDTTPPPQQKRQHVLLCTCGHWIYTHGARTEPDVGGRTYTGCRECLCEVFRNHLGECYVAGERRELPPDWRPVPRLAKRPSQGR